MKATLVIILARKFPGVPFTCIGNRYDRLERHDGGPVPSLEEIESHRAEVERDLENERIAFQMQQDFRENFPGRLMAIFDELEPSAQKKWYKNGTKAGMKDALNEGKIDIAKEILMDAEPSSQEEEEVRKAMLALFP